MTSWTGENIKNILLQLNKRLLPFQKYCFTDLENGPRELGHGAFATVYEASRRGKNFPNYAIKVVGFGEKDVLPKDFWEEVRLQRKLSAKIPQVVEVYDAVALCVTISGQDTVEEVQILNEQDLIPPEKENSLILYFLLMERLARVFTKRLGKPLLYPKALEEQDEKEILKFAFDIGSVLSAEHKENILHRDIKLENVFYSEKSKCYKLGDFGIARATKDGFTHTAAFTNGYGAPEVVSTYRQTYDCTADIYSFGIMLYLLLNDLRFPESNSYRVNIKMQYAQGYCVGNPKKGSDTLCQIVRKMCNFYPQDRYQSVEEVLTALEEVQYGRSVKYQRTHTNAPLAMGTLCGIFGIFIWNMVNPSLEIGTMSVWEGIFFLFCLIKTGLKLLDKKLSLCSWAIFITGVIWIFAEGFTIFKLILTVIMSIFLTASSGVIALWAIVGFAASQIPDMDFSYKSKWVPILFLGFAIFFLIDYELLQIRDSFLSQFFLSRNRLWKMAFAAFLSCAFFGAGCEKFFSVPTTNPRVWGLTGAAVCFWWIARQYILSKIEERRINKEK